MECIQRDACRRSERKPPPLSQDRVHWQSVAPRKAWKKTSLTKLILPGARVELDDEVTKVYQDVFNREYQRALLREAAAKAKLEAEKSMRAKNKKGSTFSRVLGTLSELGKGLDQYEFGGLNAFYPEPKTKRRSK